MHSAHSYHWRAVTQHGRAAWGCDLARSSLITPRPHSSCGHIIMFVRVFLLATTLLSLSTNAAAMADDGGFPGGGPTMQDA